MLYLLVVFTHMSLLEKEMNNEDTYVVKKADEQRAAFAALANTSIALDNVERAQPALAKARAIHTEISRSASMSEALQRSSQSQSQGQGA